MNLSDYMTAGIRQLSAFQGGLYSTDI